MTESGREIELKFHCAPEHLPAVLAAAPVGAEVAKDLISVYFDTPDRALERAGVSLRVRDSGGRRVQTLKRGKGLFREEHETPVEEFTPDPTNPELAKVLAPGAAACLAPAFYVGVHRRQRLVRVGGAEIEIAVDQGEVRAVHGMSAISEVELELKAGSPSALFDLARQLLTAAPLYLSFDGKASVGQALTAGPKARARRREALDLKPDATAAEAFQAVARAALGQIAGNAQMLREAPSSEAVHQLRVAARRLRSAISTFAPLVKDARREPVKAELKWLAKACDRARDLDVYASGARRELKALKPRPPGFDALMARLDAERASAAEAVRQVVSSARFRYLLLDATAWAETGAWLSDPERAGLRDAAARGFGAARLDRHLRRLKDAARHFGEASDGQRHHVRIQAKKVRYAAEAFAGLFEAEPVANYLRRVKRLQDELGALNDAAVALPLIDTLDLDAEAAFAAGELAGLRVAARADGIEAAAKALKRLKEEAPFWR